MLPTMTCWELVNRIHSTLGERHKDAMYEGILTGADDDTVSGILVTNEPSVDAIRLAVASDMLSLCVIDDGRGGADPASGTGLRGLADRAEALGGSLTIDSPPGHGTTVTLRLPLAETAAHRSFPSDAEPVPVTLGIRR